MSGIELGTVCMCIYKLYVDEPVTLISIIFNFLLSSSLVVIGLKVNLKFREKLEEEKRNTPLGRKGNVIEPIMRWYLNLTIIHWPYVIGFMWLNTNEILPATWFSNCWIMNLLMQPMRIGRSIIAYNSFFVALIRYLYIVHREMANEWDFEKIGNRFQYASIGVPIILELLRIFTEVDLLGLKEGEGFRNCVAMNEGLSSAENMTLPDPSPVQLSTLLISASTVKFGYYIYLLVVALIFSNAIEGYFYLKIFQSINRSNDEGHSNGALSDELYQRGKKRSLVSLKVCIISWLVEFSSTFSFVAYTSLKSFGYRKLHYPDCILTFLIIPAVYLINDEETRGVIAEENRYQGFRYMLGMRNEVIPAAAPQSSPRRSNNQ